MQDPISTTGTLKSKSRRSYTNEFKRHIVSLCDQGEKSTAQIALEHKINANLIHKWSRLLKQSDQQPMVPVALSATTVVTDPSSRVEVLLDSATIRFYGSVDAQSASAVLSALK